MSVDCYDKLTKEELLKKIPVRCGCASSTRPFSHPFFSKAKVLTKCILFF
jgi:hypothetical protein